MEKCIVHDGQMRSEVLCETQGCDTGGYICQAKGE